MVFFIPALRPTSTLTRALVCALTALGICAALSIPCPVAYSQQTAALPSAAVSPTLQALRDDLAKRIDTRVAARLRSLGEHTRIGISVVDGRSGALLFVKDARQGFAAASNAKIITMAAALHYLGPEFTFRTELLATGIEPSGTIAGNLYIRGRGNALFDAADMSRLVRHLKAKGVTRIDGRIIVDNSYFDEHNLPPHFNEQPTETASFRAPIAATSYNFNSFALYVRPSLSGQGPTRIEVRPPGDYVRIDNTSITVAKGRSKLKMHTSEEGAQVIIALSGQLRAEVVQRRFRKRVPDPVFFVGSGLRAALSEAGIRVRKKKVRAGKAPEDAIVLASHESPPLATTIRAMGKYSNNFVAEMLLKVIGAEVKAKAEGTPATWQQGVDAVHEFLSGIGIASGSYRYENGSGLFDSNKLSPQQLTQVLLAAYRNPRWSSEFFSSLSIAATDGTLHGRMEKSAASGIVRAKTGTLDHASALSGLAALDARSPLLFSILVNDFPENAIGSVRALQDEIASELILALKARSL